MATYGCGLAEAFRLYCTSSSSSDFTAAEFLQADAMAVAMLSALDDPEKHPIDVIRTTFGDDIGPFLSAGTDVLEELVRFREALCDGSGTLPGRISGLPYLATRRAVERVESLIIEMARQLPKRTMVVLNRISDGIVCFDESWHFTYVSQGATRLTDITPESLLGRTLWDCYPQILGTKFESGMRRAVEHREVVTVEDHFAALDTWFRCRVFPASDGVTVIFQNVTNEREADIERQQQAAVIERCSDAIVVVDEECHIRAWKGQSSQIFGWRAEEVANRPLASVIGIPHDDCLGIIADITSGQSIRNLEIPAKTRSDESIYLSLSAAMMQCPVTGHNVYGIVMRDVTRSHKLRQELTAAKEASEAASHAKTEFLANMSHEIRTPLSVILGYTALLADRPVLDQEIRDHLKVVRRSASFLHGLIDDLLDLSRIESGHTDLNRQPVELRPLVDDVESVLRPKAREKHLAFSVDMDLDLPRSVMGDLGRMRQILVNLVSNAIKFTELGEVRLEVRWRPKRSRPLRFIITDTGRGISREEQERVFEPFSREARATAMVPGTGLGLPLARRLARLLGGDLILVRSYPERGSQFRVELPGELVQIPAEERRHAVSSAPALLTGYRFLLAEDTPELQALTKYHLTEAGAAVDVCRTGTEAVKNALETEYNAILMDIEMPEMNGYDATESLRRQGFSKPIIALTAHALSSERSRCLEVGCTDFITKPVDPERLVRLLANSVKR